LRPRRENRAAVVPDSARERGQDALETSNLCGDVDDIADFVDLAAVAALEKAAVAAVQPQG